jgi:hypothetical protein
MVAAFSWQKPAHRFALVMAAIALLLFIVEHINGRSWMHDFRVYHGAAGSLLRGEELYGVSHGLGTGIFKYAPFMAFLFVPLAVLPYALASSIHYALIVAAFIGSMVLANRLLQQHLFTDGRSSSRLLFLAALVVIVHLHRELHLGNINMMLLWLLLLALHHVLDGRERLGGLLIGLAILAKPHFLILLPLLVMRGLWRPLLFTGIALVAGLMLPALFMGWKGNLALHDQWFHHMARHNASLVYTGGEGYEAVNTLYSLVHRTIVAPFTSLPPSWTPLVVLGSVAILFALLVLVNRRRNGRQHKPSLLLEFLLLVALVPSLTLTDTEHFLFALPLVMMVMHSAMQPGRPSWLLPLTIAVFFAYGGNWEDALGPLSPRMVHYGVLGLGNILLILLTVHLFLQGRFNLSRAGTGKE